MPNKDNAKKALRQAKKKAILNQTYRNNFREAIKKTIKSSSKDEALKMVRLAQKALDKAAKHGTIKKNTAARRLSRMMTKINKMVKK